MTAYLIALTITMLFTLVVHEGGHIMAILLTHAGRVKNIAITWKGIGVRWEPFAYEPFKRAIVSLAGPAVNLAFAAAFYTVGLPLLGLAGLVFAIVNLLPLPGSDGLRAYYNLKAAVSQAF